MGIKKIYRMTSSDGPATLLSDLQK